MSKDELILLAKTAATNQGLDEALICGLIEQESGWHPYITRYEPGFDKHYVQPLHLDWTEDKGRSTSFGLLQCMGEVLRELGYSGGFSSLMEDIPSQLAYGCKHFKNKLERAGGDIHKALLAWNGGSRPAYADEVLARVETYTSGIKPPQKVNS